MTGMGTNYSASCPVCGYEHDFPTKRAMDVAWARWHRVILTTLSRSGWKRPAKGATS